jgi:hypothetical protein
LIALCRRICYICDDLHHHFHDTTFIFDFHWAYILCLTGSPSFQWSSPRPLYSSITALSQSCTAILMPADVIVALSHRPMTCYSIERAFDWSYDSHRLYHCYIGSLHFMVYTSS